MTASRDPDTRIVLRFRDLVTPPGGTISEHRRLIGTYGVVWWGWWKRQWEEVPYSFFRHVLDRLEDASIEVYLFDVDTSLLYTAGLRDIKVAPLREGMLSPSIEKTPAYYRQGRYPAWFALTDIRDMPQTDLQLSYDCLPSASTEDQQRLPEAGTPIASLTRLRSDPVTLWVVRVTSPEPGGAELRG